MIRPTKNLSIRPFEKSDVPKMKEWFYSGDYPEFFRDMLALNEEQLGVYAYIKDGQGFVIWKGSEPIGFIILYEIRAVAANAKLGILIDKKYQEQKFCLEAMVEMVRYVFERLRMEKLIVEVLKSNVRLQEILQKGGFTKEAVFEREAKIGEYWEDVCKYVLFKGIFSQMKKELEVFYGR